MYEFLCEINLFTTCWSFPYSSAGPKDKKLEALTCFWERTMYHRKMLVSCLDDNEAPEYRQQEEGHLH